LAARHRLGVVLLLEGPIADEINGLRRALGDAALGRIGPHVTLVPPVNVRVGDLDAALGVVRSAAAACGRPLTVILGPPSTFLPANPVVHLPVSGDLPRLTRLRDAVFTGPLERSLRWPWVPHVTLADDADPGTIPPALAVLRAYEAVTVVERVVVLEERHGPAGRRWEPWADADLAPRVVVGRGGLDLTLTGGRVLDPAAARLVEDAGLAVPAPGVGLVVTGVSEGRLAGVAAAWRTDAGGRVLVVVDPERRRSGFGRQLLARVESAVRAAGWDCPTLIASGPAGFYAACSGWSAPQA
jgi:2'-5' RNA ligase